jgi:hypothetical protein
MIIVLGYIFVQAIFYFAEIPCDGHFFTLHFSLTGVIFLDFCHLPNCMRERYKKKPWVEEMKT